VLKRSLVFLFAFAAGCTCTAKPDETPETRTITLTKGDKLSVRVGTEGDSKITVKIAAGKPDAGTYTTTSGALLDDARDASTRLNEPGATVWIRVDEQNQIVVIGNSQKIP
jgi:hypothetical protein